MAHRSILSFASVVVGLLLGWMTGADAADHVAMPYACALSPDGPLLTRSPQRQYEIVGKVEDRRIAVCRGTDRATCRPVVVHRFDIVCGGTRLDWPTVVAAALRLDQRPAWVDRGQLHIAARRVVRPSRFGCDQEPPLWGISAAESFSPTTCRGVSTGAAEPQPTQRFPIGYAPLELAAARLVLAPRPSMPSPTVVDERLEPPQAYARRMRRLLTQEDDTAVVYDARPEPKPLPATPPAARSDASSEAAAASPPAGRLASLVAPWQPTVAATPPPPEPAAVNGSVDPVPPQPSPLPLPPPTSAAPIAAATMPVPRPPEPRESTSAIAAAPPPQPGSQQASQPAEPAVSAGAEPDEAADWLSGAASHVIDQISRAFAQVAEWPLPVVGVALGSLLALGSLVAVGRGRTDVVRNPPPESSRVLVSRVTGIGELQGTVDQLFTATELVLGRLEAAPPLQGVLRQESDLIRQRLAILARPNGAPLDERQQRQRLQGGIRELYRIIKIAEGAAASFASSGTRLSLPQSREAALDLLGVNADVGQTTLKKVVDALRVSWHPDHARDEADRLRREERTKQINVAWDLIRDRSAATG